ncbi:MAG TPA: hypothetical protein VFD43_08085, partial [Planctomycetota bacterium]|nr:hypothetical protein [Planctomycetota bacterium]
MSTGSDDQSFHDRAQALFLRALERPEAGRAAWVEGECAGDRRLADEVASLLRHHRPAAELIAAQALPARLLVVRDASAPAWTRPRRMLLVVLALLAALGVGGALVQLQVRAALKDSLEDHLVSLLQTGVTGLTVWMSQTVVDADLIATRPEVAGQALELAQSGDGSAEQQARRAELGRMLDADCARRGWQGWSLVRLSDARVVAVGGPQASTGKALEAVGRTLTPDAHAALAELVERGAQVAPPHALGSALEGDPGGGEPVVTVAAVVRQDATPAAALAFQIDPGTAFTKILGRTGTGQGESFAFDRQGRLLSDSAYEDELRAAGWLGEQGAMLNLVLRDPGVDLLAGEQPAEPLDTRPLTEAVRYALARRESQFEPYRSYSGQMVVGAWTWLDEFDFGVAKELPLEQAYAPLVPWRRVLIGLWALLGLVGLAVLALSLAIRRLRERVE